MAAGRGHSWLDGIRAGLDGAHRRVDFFFRDDDVGWCDARLWELLDLFAEYELPVDLAVIPNSLGDDLARGLLRRTERSGHAIGFHQHGFGHVNHEPTGRKYEFGPTRPASLQRRDIVEGRRRLRDLLGPSLDPIFVPPWNRCTRTTGRCLGELGFEVLSREAKAAPLNVPGLAELPVKVDWFARRKRVRLNLDEFGAVVAHTIREGSPVGVMFHHAPMDAGDLTAARLLLELIACHPTASPKPMRALAHSIVTD